MKKVLTALLVLAVYPISKAIVPKIENNDESERIQKISDAAFYKDQTQHHIEKIKESQYSLERLGYPGKSHTSELPNLSYLGTQHTDGRHLSGNQ